MNNTTETATGELFSRDGHLTMLTLDRFDAGELPVDSCDAVIEHVRTCSQCTSRLDEVQDVPEGTPTAHPSIAARIEPQRPRTAAVALGSAIAAAVLVLLAWPQPEQASRVMEESGLTASNYTTTAAVPEEYGSAALELRAQVGASEIRNLDYVPADAEVYLDVSYARPGFIAVVAFVDGASDDGGTDGPAESNVRVILPATSTSELANLSDELRVSSDPLGYGETEQQRVAAVYCPESFDVSTDTSGFVVFGGGPVDECDMIDLEFVWTAEAADS